MRFGRTFAHLVGALLTVAAFVASPASAQTTAVRVYDTFTGANGQSLPAHAPDTNPYGHMWTVDRIGDLPFWGTNSDLPVPADYDGDHKVDIAVWRPSNGIWYILKSSSNYTTNWQVVFGASTDLPVPGDYDGDGKADIAVYRPSTGQRWILSAASGYTASSSVYWGISTDIPVVGDFDGDGWDDYAVYRPSAGAWYILTSRLGTEITVFWGANGDVPVPGDYDLDGVTDIAIYRPSTGVWWVSQSSDGTTDWYQWGNAQGSQGNPTTADIPTVGDFDGDHIADLAVYRPSTGEWRILTSTSGYNPNAARIIPWGSSSGIVGPIIAPGDYDGDGVADIAVFEPSTGAWYVVDSAMPTLLNGELTVGQMLPGIQFATIDAGPTVGSLAPVSATAEWHFPGPTWWGGVTLRYVDDQNLLLAVYQDGEGIALWRRVEGVWTVLAARALPAADGIRHRLRAAASGSLVRVYWDDVQQLEVTDDSGLGGTRAGIAWHTNHDAQARVDAFAIDANMPPAVSIALLPDSQLFDVVPRTVRATVADTDGSVAGAVRFFVNGVDRGDGSPYDFYWDEVAGSHRVTAVVTDNVGAVTRSMPLLATICTSTVSPVTATFPNGGGTGALTLTNISPGCVWTAQNDHPSWLHLTSGTSGTTNGSVTYKVDRNTSFATRVAHVKVAGYTATITQSPRCVSAVSTYQLELPSEEIHDHLQVAAPEGCTWGGASSGNWLEAGLQYVGPQEVTYHVSANNTGHDRAGTLYIDQMEVAVLQHAATNPSCVTSLHPNPVTVDPAGWNWHEISVTTQPNCTWTPESSAPEWLTVLDWTGYETGVIFYMASANNTGADRRATMTVAGVAIDFTQPIQNGGGGLDPNRWTG